MGPITEQPTNEYKVIGVDLAVPETVDYTAEYGAKFFKGDWAALPAEPLKCLLRSGQHTTFKCQNGHGFDPAHEPRHPSCQSCWLMYFYTRPSELIAGINTIQSLGTEPLKRIRNRKYIRALVEIERKWELHKAEIAAMQAAVAPEDADTSNENAAIEGGQLVTS